jgi:peptidoglycan/xylan/chitin deacetylase (PgdA/CDA1 family)
MTFKRYPPTDDRVVVAYYGSQGPHHIIYDFCRAPVGSPERGDRVRQYERFIEALKGQGCQVFVWDITRWAGYKKVFYSGRLKREQV